MYQPDVLDKILKATQDIVRNNFTNKYFSIHDCLAFCAEIIGFIVAHPYSKLIPYGNDAIRIASKIYFRL